MTEEQWRPVPDFEGRYEVSDQGRVRSLDRIVPRKGLVRGRVLSLGPHPGGYLLAHLYPGGAKRVARTVHGLVAEVFLGPRPAGMQVCHADGDPKNNAVPNLRYDTPVGNNADKRPHGTAPLGEKHAGAKLTAREVAIIRSLRGCEPQKDTADRFGITFSNVSAIQRRKSWRHV